jgi:Cu(I)/Ag(I) efflux system membrane protein CusA/SilA
MMDALIDACAKNRFLVFLFVVVLTLFGVHALNQTKLDAIPDLSDTQVIVYSKWDRSPDIIEDQVTYPITTALLGMPKVKAVRGFSDFGYSYVYLIFEEGTDIYWARSRTLEYLNAVTPKLPSGVSVQLAKDATSVGWVFQYALVDTSGQNSLDEIRSYQDWYLGYALQAVPGVAEVAPLGGFVRQYQVTIDPQKLLGYKIPINDVVAALQKGNNDVGARLVEHQGREYMIRGRGYIKSPQDIASIVVKSGPTGAPVLMRDIAKISLGPDIRRGVAELNGDGETVGGIVIMRVGENADRVIKNVKAKIKEIEPQLPKGLQIVPTYDRSDLIARAIENLKHTLIEELLIVSLVILLFLWHFPSAIVPILTIPVTVVLAFIPIQFSGMTANIMSLGGIAVAIGAMVDAAIVVVEQVHKKMEQASIDRKQAIITAVKEVAPPSFFALLVIAVSFMPVFTLEAQEGRLFTPLAYTKTFAMVIAALLAVTLVPAAIALVLGRDKPFVFRPLWLSKILTTLAVGKIHSEADHPISRPLMKLYEPAVRWVLDHQGKTIAVALIAMAVTIPAFWKLGSEFMPPLDEGTLLYMPTTLPGLSVTEASRILQQQDKIIKSFPEVERVFGKAGRAETATDPAPFSMMETTIVLKPKNEWPKIERWYSDKVPEFIQPLFRMIWSDQKTTQDLIYGAGGLNEALSLPGLASSWTMPIKGRIDMLTTGVRTPIGIKILGSDLAEIERIGKEIETAIKTVSGTSSAFAERTSGGYFLDFDIKRESLSRYGLSVDDVNSVLTSALGGETVTTTVEGRERYGISVRYMRDFRSDLSNLKNLLINTPSGAQIPVSQVADLVYRTGPGMIRDENGRLSGYVYVDFGDRDIGSYVRDAKRAVEGRVTLPPAYELIWSGQYEAMERVKARLEIILPITLFAVFLLLYFNTKSATKTCMILLAVPFSAIGAVWFLFILGYNMSIAVWVGLIALLGVDAETAVFMLMYLDMAYHEATRDQKSLSKSALNEAIVAGAVKRLRPKLMTVACMLFGLLPVMWADGAGSDVMKRIAAPMIGGIVTSFLMELLIYPALFAIWKNRRP